MPGGGGGGAGGAFPFLDRVLGELGRVGGGFHLNVLVSTWAGRLVLLIHKKHTHKKKQRGPDLSHLCCGWQASSCIRFSGLGLHYKSTINFPPNWWFGFPVPRLHSQAASCGLLKRVERSGGLDFCLEVSGGLPFTQSQRLNPPIPPTN